MKIVHSQYHAARATVPVLGGYEAVFTNHRAVLPDEVATTLVQMGGGHYRILAEDLSAVQPGGRVLLIRDCGMGDVLLLTPLIRRLHEDRGILVDVLTAEHHRCLFDGNPNVVSTFALGTPDAERAVSDPGYAYVLDLRMVVENAEHSGIHRHRADAFAAYADLTLHGEEDRRLDYFVSDAERQFFDTHFALCEKRSLPDGSLPETIGYVWRASTGTNGNRSWSDAQHATVLQTLLAAGYVVILLDAEPVAAPVIKAAGIDDCNLIDWTGILSIRETGAVLEACDVVFTPDTGLFHLAGALGKPVVTYFGAFPVEERHAHTKLNVINDAKGACALAPCRSYSCLNRDERGQPRCLAATPERVLGSVAAFLKEKKEKRDGSTGLGRSSAPTGEEPTASGGEPGGDQGSGSGAGPGNETNDLGANPAGDGQASE